MKLTKEQISMLIQIINKNTFVGEQLEIILNLKNTLILILKEFQEEK
jgi:hypothetical protein